MAGMTLIRGKPFPIKKPENEGGESGSLHFPVFYFRILKYFRSKRGCFGNIQPFILE